MMLLLSILVIPLFASILINICPTGNQIRRISFPNVSTSLEISSKDIVKYLPIFSSLITLLIIIVYAGQNNLITKSTHEELIKLYDLFPSLNVSMSFSATKISIALLVLSNITIITALFSTLNIEKRLNQINTLISIISVGIFGLILADDLFVFFVFYEIAVVPMFLIITNWGYSLEREVSGPFSKILNTLSVGTKNYGAYKITLYLLNGSMLKQNLIDEIIIYIAPCILGDEAKNMFRLQEISAMSDRYNFDLIQVDRTGEDVRIILKKSDQA